MLDQALWWMKNRSAEQAFRWLDGFEQALSNLANEPERWAIARESEAFGFELRELHYGVHSRPTHRAVFQICGEEVVVYSVRHLHQQDLAPGDL